MTIYRRADTSVSMTDPQVCPICYSRMPMGGDISVREHVSQVHQEWSKVEEEKPERRRRYTRKPRAKAKTKKSAPATKASSSKTKKKKGKK